MATKECLDNIHKEGGTYCGQETCGRFYPQFSKYCAEWHFPSNTPIPLMVDGKVCYCCCGSVVEETLVQTTETESAPIQDIKIGDKVMGTDLDATRWTPRLVTSASGVAPGHTLGFMRELHLAFDGSPDIRRLIVTADHLFVTIEDGRRLLISAESLEAGDAIVRADGGMATVVSNAPREHNCGVRLIALGDYEGGSLDGHLTNVNGLLSADYSVQAWFYSNGLAPHLAQSR